MKKGSLIIKIVIIAIIASVGLVATFYVNGYFSVWSSKLRVDKVDITVNVDSNGMAHVVEHDYYTFTKPYHGLSPYTQFPNGISMSNFNLSVAGATIQKTEGNVDRNGFNLLVYLNNGYTIPKPNGDNVVMNLSYDVNGEFQTGTNFSQFFYKFWGKHTPSWVPLITVHYIFAPNFNVERIFPHPLDVSHQVVMNGKHEFTITYHNVPPDTYAEARVVFPLTKVKYASPISMTMDQMNEIENGYTGGMLFQWIWIFILIALIPIIPLLFKRLFGTEPKVDVAEYEREIPYDNPPEFVNSVVKRLISEPDHDGFAAAILNLVDKGYLEFSDQNNFKILEGKKPLSESENILFNTIIKPFSTGDIFDPKEIGESMKGNIQRAQKFNEAFTNWKMKVEIDAESKNYLLTYGNTITKIVTFLALIVLPLALVFLNIYMGRAYPHLLMILSWVAFADWIAAWIILILPRDIFGRWTKTGRIYYLRWKHFEKYLTDYSLIKEKPPESLIIWRQYLIYGTALGIAKHVIKAIKEINPPEIAESDPFFPAFTTLFWYDSIIMLPQSAMINANIQQGGNMGNFGGGGFGGNIGGGFGGGGRGGF